MAHVKLRDEGDVGPTLFANWLGASASDRACRLVDPRTKKAGEHVERWLVPRSEAELTQAMSWLPAGLHHVDDWEARIGVEASGGEECGAHVSVEQRVAAAAVRGGDPLRLGDGVGRRSSAPARASARRWCARTL